MKEDRESVVDFKGVSDTGIAVTGPTGDKQTSFILAGELWFNLPYDQEVYEKLQVWCYAVKATIRRQTLHEVKQACKEHPTPIKAVEHLLKTS